MPTKSFAVAMIDALAYSLKSDPNVVVIGAHSFLSDRGLKPEDERALWDAFPDRLIDPPTSEGVTTSLATGAAMAGMRPFLNFGTATFAYEAFNQIMSETANVHAMSNGQLRAPLTLHMFAGIRGGGAAQHSSSPQAMYANAAGLELVLPASPADAQGLLRSAILSDNPTIVITHTKLLRETGEVPDGDYTIPFGKARDRARRPRRHHRRHLADGARGAQSRRGAGEGRHRSRSCRSPHHRAARRRRRSALPCARPAGSSPSTRATRCAASARRFRRWWRSTPSML